MTNMTTHLTVLWLSILLFHFVWATEDITQRCMEVLQLHSTIAQLENNLTRPEGGGHIDQFKEACDEFLEHQCFYEEGTRIVVDGQRWDIRCDGASGNVWFFQEEVDFWDECAAFTSIKTFEEVHYCHLSKLGREAPFEELWYVWSAVLVPDDSIQVPSQWT
ncbi:hypothetical protein FE257_007761 [Aspergillus nanangensis]|uniref:Uncharacterized protein n=1 Tax=Aspergillus nanangensis TaxID=2582783 RepID=A0AAD4CWZ3_ASPNN|nr:hypothetical protein FE257_007761 [Aspergillus nanangensis]